MADLPGQREQTPYGPVQTIRRTLDIHARHGDAPLADALLTRPSDLEHLALDPIFAGVDPAKLLFIDTETTGLSRAAGTVPFLVGLGWYIQGRLHLEQYFLTNLGSEAPLLERIRTLLDGASALVTYNGKGYDWPLLRNRFILTRLRPPPELPHFDLLHIARRLFKYSASAWRLQDVERQVMRFVRRGDIDGAQIPEAYFRFLREGHHPDLNRIITHNQNDIIAMAALLGVLCQKLAKACDKQTASDLQAHAELSLRAGDAERAVRLAEHVLGCKELNTVGPAARLLGKHHAAQGAYSEAILCVEAALPHVSPWEEARLSLILAKLYEHRVKDFAVALGHARNARAVERPLNHAKRLERLMRKLSGKKGVRASRTQAVVSSVVWRGPRALGQETSRPASTN